MRRLLFLAALPMLLALTIAAAGCGGAETVEPLPDSVEGTIQAETLPAGNAEAGASVFESQGCGGCHTYEPAGSNAEVGPNLDEVLQGKDAEFIRSSIVNPNAEIAEGFQPNVMPGDYGQKLSDQDLADLVAFLQQ
jgi:mono/diheme cytochrome c family protein